MKPAVDGWRWLAVLLALHGCAAPDEAPVPEATPVAHVGTVVARRGAIRAVLDVTGGVEAVRPLHLASPIGGRVTFLAARPGDRVAEGEVVARVVPLEAEAALEGFAMLERAGALDADERRAAARLSGRSGDVPLRAPFAAVVAERARNPGEQVAAGDVVLELYDPRALEVLADVPLADARRLRADMPVEVRGRGWTRAGRVATRLAAITPTAMTVPVRIALATPPDEPLLHDPVRCRIVTVERRHALLVPRSALVGSARAGRGVVMVAADGIARRRTVRTGIVADGEVQIRHGLRTGEAVVADGGYGLPDGTPIDAAPATP